MNQSDYDLDKIENALINASREQTTTQFQEYYLNSTEVNMMFKNNFTLCIEIESATHIDTSHSNLEDFLLHFFRKEFEVFEKCFYDISKFLQKPEK